ncbi:MAG: acetylglutamate kinase [Gemmatimonadaceae bacterium]
MTRVIKLGGRTQNDPQLSSMVGRAVARERVCIVHGGGDEVTALMRQLGREPTFVQGRRVTTAEDIAIVRMVLSGTVNKRLVAQFLTARIRAVGLSGEDGGLLEAHPFGGGSLGAVGEPGRVHTGLIDVLLDAGYLPVISPLARGPAGDALNVNGDDAAAAIAGALGASELLLVADVAGVLDASGTVIPELCADDVERLVVSGIATRGMAAKLDAALRALQLGVVRARIGDLRAIEDDAAGTSILLSPSVV